MIFDPKNIHTDERVDMALRACTKCGAELPDHKVTTSIENVIMAFNQCPQCKTVFIIGDMTVWPDVR